MNNNNILLISEQYVKERSAILNNVEDKFIQSHIFQAQDIDIQYIIGSNLYTEVIDEFNDYKLAIESGATGVTVSDFVTDDNITLVNDYIQPALLYYTLSNSMFDLYAKITNKGIVTQSSDNSETISDVMFNKMKSNYDNKAEYYGTRLTDFLIANSSKYPKYLNGVNTIDDIQPSTQSSYFSGMYLKSGKRRCIFDLNKRPY